MHFQYDPNATRMQSKYDQVLPEERTTTPQINQTVMCEPRFFYIAWTAMILLMHRMLAWSDYALLQVKKKLKLDTHKSRLCRMMVTLLLELKTFYLLCYQPRVQTLHFFPCFPLCGAAYLGHIKSTFIYQDMWPICLHEISNFKPPTQLSPQDSPWILRAEACRSEAWPEALMLHRWELEIYSGVPPPQSQEVGQKTQPVHKATRTQISLTLYMFAGGSPAAWDPLQHRCGAVRASTLAGWSLHKQQTKACTIQLPYAMIPRTSLLWSLCWYLLRWVFKVRDGCMALSKTI